MKDVRTDPFMNYEAIPTPGSYNLNSFTHDLIHSVGGQGPGLFDENFPDIFPGCYSPISRGAFNSENQ